MEVVFAALIGQLGLLVPFWFSQRSTRKKAEADRAQLAEDLLVKEQQANESRARIEDALGTMHEEVRTNNGMRAGEYIELIPTLLAQATLHEKHDAERFARLGIV